MKKIIFHHIPKSAGSTLQNAILEVNKNNCLSIGKEGINYHSNKNLSDLSFIGGHFTYPDIAEFECTNNATFVSLIRNPLRRIISYFEMVYRDNHIFKNEICYKDKWGYCFEVYYDRFIVTAGLCNLICKYFSKIGKYYDAVVTITNYFTLVGTVDKFDDFSNILINEYFKNTNLIKPHSFPRKNISTNNEPLIELISPDILLRIKNDNQEDFLFYDWIRERHDGIYLKHR